MWVDGLKHLCEGVEEAPCVPGDKCVVGWFTPFLEHARHLTGSDRSAIDSPDHKIVSLLVGQEFLLVGDDAPVEVMELVAELSYGPGSELPKVAHGVAGVFPAKLHFSIEGEVITDKYLGAGNEASG